MSLKAGKGERMERLALSVRETARALGASPASVWRWITSGELPAVRIGGRVFISHEALRRRLEREDTSPRVQTGRSKRHTSRNPEPTCPTPKKQGEL